MGRVSQETIDVFCSYRIAKNPTFGQISRRPICVMNPPAADGFIPLRSTQVMTMTATIKTHEKNEHRQSISSWSIINVDKLQSWGANPYKSHLSTWSHKGNKRIKQALYFRFQHDLFVTTHTGPVQQCKRFRNDIFKWLWFDNKAFSGVMRALLSLFS